eukprot:TRINITY_DN80314_c0_g1_i1.p1 TRINITY_DN80314_c0_g1~~TRINITY_DN80314_c0_g1_i1.p1  ORF type:complete len:218 (-),score=40.88 TRINITY_DN80314_c0_g1_i1:68-721(-)
MACFKILAFVMATQCVAIREELAKVTTANDLEIIAKFHLNKSSKCNFMSVKEARAQDPRYVGELTDDDFAELDRNPNVLAYSYGKAYKGKNQILAFWYEEETAMILGYFAKAEKYAPGCAGRLVLQKDGGCENVPTSTFSCPMCPSCKKSWTGCDVGAGNGGKRFAQGKPVVIDGFVNGEVLAKSASGQWNMGGKAKQIYVCGVSTFGSVDAAPSPN